MHEDPNLNHPLLAGAAPGVLARRGTRLGAVPDLVVTVHDEGTPALMAGALNVVHAAVAAVLGFALLGTELVVPTRRSRLVLIPALLTRFSPPRSS